MLPEQCAQVPERERRFPAKNRRRLVRLRVWPVVMAPNVPSAPCVANDVPGPSTGEYGLTICTRCHTAPNDINVTSLCRHMARENNEPSAASISSNAPNP